MIFIGFQINPTNWMALQAYVSNINFDYMEYARQRLQQYWIRQFQILRPFLALLDNEENGF